MRLICIVDEEASRGEELDNSLELRSGDEDGGTDAEQSESEEGEDDDDDDDSVDNSEVAEQDSNEDEASDREESEFQDGVQTFSKERVSSDVAKGQSIKNQMSKSYLFMLQETDQCIFPFLIYLFAFMYL